MKLTPPLLFAIVTVSNFSLYSGEKDPTYSSHNDGHKWHHDSSHHSYGTKGKDSNHYSGEGRFSHRQQKERRGNSSYQVTDPNNTNPYNPIVTVEHFSNALKTVDIDTFERGLDYAEAFKRLRRRSPNSNIFAVVKGRSFDRIQEMEAMSNASLIMIHYGGTPYIQTEVVAVEDIEELGIRGYAGSPVHVYFPQSTDHKQHDHHQVHDVEDIPDHHIHPHVHINATPYPHDIRGRENRDREHHHSDKKIDVFDNE